MKKDEKIEVLARNISGLFEYQDDALKVYEESLQMHFDFTKTLSTLFDRQLDLLEHDKVIPENILNATTLLQKHHDETQRVSRNFLSQQSDFAQSASNLLKNQLLKYTR